MAYNAQQHAVVAERIRDYFRALQSLREEGERLRTIVVDLAGNGSDEAFVATADYTEQELVNVVSMANDLEAFLVNGVVASAFRTVWLNPFLP